MITVLTPTYNRASFLPGLYNSLIRQINKSFVWLIIDDGSIDCTRKIVEEWQKENLISIRYIYKTNGGKHTALNTGIAYVKTELTFIVDSDDLLPENSIDIILQYHSKYKDMEGLCGYSFLRYYPDGKVNEAYFPQEELIDTYVNARINAGIEGDKAEVFYTEILRKFPFPVFKGEKFVPEDLIWIQMSGPYKMVHINRCVYISEYLNDGLTRSGKKMKMKSPMAMTKRAELYLNSKSINVKTKCKMILLYIIYGHVAKFSNKELLKRLGVKGMYLLAFFPGMLLYYFWKKQYGVENEKITD